MSTAILATGRSAAGRRVLGSFDLFAFFVPEVFSDPLGISAAFVDSSDGMSGSRSIAPSFRVSATVPSYQITHTAGHGEPQSPVPGRTRTRLTALWRNRQDEPIRGPCCPIGRD